MAIMMKGLKLWIMTLVEYDQYGNATVVKSFSKPAIDSTIKSGAKIKRQKTSTKSMGEETIW